VLVVDALEKAWGPGYLSFGLGLNSDFKGDSRFGLRATYRQTWINDLGGEWLSTINLGNEPRLFSEFYQPLNMEQSVFVAPYIDLGQVPLNVFQGDTRVARYDVARYRAGLDLGANPGGIAELRIGVMAGQVDADLDTGSTLVPQVRRNESGMRARLLYDTRDSGALPRTGGFAEADLFAPLTSLGAEDQYFRTELKAGQAVNRGANTLLLNLRGGSAFGDQMPYYDQFPLGGFQKLSGYANEQFRGNDYAFGSLVLQHQLTTLTPPLGKGLYLGASEHLRGVGAGRGGDLGAAEHAGDLVDALVARPGADLGVGLAVDGLFLHLELLVGLGRDLGQVGDAERPGGRRRGGAAAGRRSRRRRRRCRRRPRRRPGSGCCRPRRWRPGWRG
jgi:NTE family protein